MSNKLFGQIVLLIIIAAVVMTLAKCACYQMKGKICPTKLCPKCQMMMQK